MTLLFPRHMPTRHGGGDIGKPENKETYAPVLKEGSRKGQASKRYPNTEWHQAEEERAVYSLAESTSHSSPGSPRGIGKGPRQMQREQVWRTEHRLEKLRTRNTS